MDVDDNAATDCCSSSTESVVSTDFLETQNADSKSWLLKCSQLVSRPFSNLPDDISRPFAKVVVSVDPLLKDDDEFTLELIRADSKNALRSYSLTMYKKPTSMFLFSESSQGKFAVEGRIVYKFVMKPHEINVERYGDLLRERNRQRKTRQIKVIDIGPAQRKPKPWMNKAAASRARSIRMDRGELVKNIIKLFDSQKYWTVKQLVQETNQPETFIREILKDICLPNKGNLRGTFELKPEFEESFDTAKRRPKR